MKTFSWSISLAIVMAACGGKAPAPPGTNAPVPAAPVAQLLLASEPANAIGVLAAKEKGAADQVVVTGRIAATTPGFAVLTLIDTALPYCGEKNKEDHCKTPWDYCCETAETRTKNSLLVEARGADGKPIRTPALGDLRLLDELAVAGKLARDEHGNHVLVASGWHRKARPQLPADLRWPQ